MSKKDPYNKKVLKKRRWKHPFMDGIKSFFASFINKFKWDKSKETIQEEPETFIQGLMRINNEVNNKSNNQSNIRELVPHKMYKAKDLLAEIRSQKEIHLKSNLKRIK